MDSIQDDVIADQNPQQIQRANNNRCVSTGPTRSPSDDQMMYTNCGPSSPISTCILLTSIVVSLSVSREIIANEADKFPAYIPQLPAIFLMLVSIPIVGLLIFCQRLTVHHELSADPPAFHRVRRPFYPRFIRHKLILIGVVPFFVLRLFPDLVQIADESECRSAWKNCTSNSTGSPVNICATHYVNLAFHVCRVAFTSSLVLLCVACHRRVVFRRTALVRHGLAVLGAAVACLWFDTWFNEMAENVRTALSPIVCDDGSDDEHRAPTSSNQSSSYHQGVRTDTYDVELHCLSGNTTTRNLLRDYGRYFYPCSFEFCLLVGHCIVGWFTASQLRATSSLDDTRLQQQATPLSPTLSATESMARHVNDSNVHSLRSTSSTSSSDSALADAEAANNINEAASAASTVNHCSTLFIVVSLIVSVCFCLFDFLGVYAFNFYTDDLQYLIQIWIDCGYYTFHAVVIVVGFVVTRRRLPVASAAAAADGVRRRSGLEYLVLATSAGPMLKSLFTIVAYANGRKEWITDPVRAANTVGQSVCIIEVVLQTTFIFHASKVALNNNNNDPVNSNNNNNTNNNTPVMTSSESTPLLNHLNSSSSRSTTAHHLQTRALRDRTMCFRTVLIVLSFSNLCIWLINSFVEIHMAYASYRFRYYRFWIPIVNFLFPIAIFYRFNSALLFLNIYLKN